MKESIGRFGVGLALLLTSFVNQGLAANQVKGTAGSTTWKAITATAPTVAIDQNGIRYVAWQNASNQIIVATSPANSNTWTLLGTSEGGPGVVGGTDWTAGTNASPALAFDSQSNQIWVAYKGQSTPTDRIWFSSWNGTSWVAQQVVICTNGTPETGEAPALGGGDGMTLAWKGGGDDDIWNTAWDGTGWGPQAKVKGSNWTAGTSTTPSWISPYINGDPNVLFWKGGSTNIWMSEYNAGSGWESQKQVTCSTNPSWIFETSYAPAAAYNNTPDGAPYAVFWTSSSSTSIFYSYETETSCGWSQPATVPNAATNAAPAVVFPLSGPGYFVAWKKATNNTIWYDTVATLKP
ncbi:MAG TPA: hypothetical protein VJX47_02635 [Candidatus Sulfotelmatobacter sp.]|nr:hypothetical protein [Candidatus Sulfotelmatobacter sp.]